MSHMDGPPGPGTGVGPWHAGLMGEGCPRAEFVSCAHSLCLLPVPRRRSLFPGGDSQIHEGAAPLPRIGSQSKEEACSLATPVPLNPEHLQPSQQIALHLCIPWSCCLSVPPSPPSVPVSSLLSRRSIDNYRASVTCQTWACLTPLKRCMLGAGAGCPGPTGVCIFIGQACAPATALAYAVVFGGSGPSSPSSTL